MISITKSIDIDPEDEDTFELCNERNVTKRGSGYGSGNCYGGDILQALAEIQGIKIEGF